MCANNDSKTKDKILDHLIDLWKHQNTLLWSRLQTLAGLQIPVLGGWYFFWTSNNRLHFAGFIAFLGVILSALIWELINCDADRRDDIRKQVKENYSKEAETLFPDSKQRFFRGLTIMQMIVGIFFLIDFALTCFAVAKLF
jgi:hypothetical protein